jgi:cysteine desulfurase family protein
MTADLKRDRVYLDNAATSWPKPESVCTAVVQYLRESGAAAGRAVYQEALDADRTLQLVRASIARLIGADDSRRIVFTLNGTDALNLALHGLLLPGDHVITSQAEHNSVLRPLHHLSAERGVHVTRLPIDRRGCVDPDQCRRAIQADTRLIALIHASNVTGAMQPAVEIGTIAREAGVLFLVDAAQTIGHVPIDVGHLRADLLAAPGHKGLLGPTGTGILYVGPRAEPRLRSLRQGGTGTQSEWDRQPEDLPEKYEAGIQNLAGIVGLGAGVEYLLQRGVSAIERHEQALTLRLLRAWEGEPRVQVHGPAGLEDRVGVVTVSVDGYDPQELAAMLDASRRIQVRAGLHCAPGVHRALGTLGRGGALRFSVGALNDAADVDVATRTLGEFLHLPSPITG